MSDSTQKKASSSEPTQSPKLVLMEGSGANINRMVCNAHPADCPLLAYWMDKAATCRINPLGREKCMYATPVWCSAISIFRKPKLGWLVGGPELSNGKTSSSVLELMAFTIAIEHLRRTCSKSHMTQYRRMTTMIMTSLLYVMLRSVVDMALTTEWSVINYLKLQGSRIMKLTRTSSSTMRRLLSWSVGGMLRKKGSGRTAKFTMRLVEDSKSSSALTMTYLGRSWLSIHSQPLGIRSPKSGIKVSPTISGLTMLALQLTFMTILSASLLLLLLKLL